jgi:hypothetical protein
MALPVTFATLAGGNEALTLLDTQFSAVAALGSIPCAAAGQNTISLTPFANTPAVSSYTDLAPSFVFAAAQTSSGSVTINVAVNGARNAYKWNGSQQCGSGDIIAGNVYRATPLAALNGGAGGFVVDAIGSRNNQTDIQFIIDGGGSVIATGVKGFLRIPWPATITAWHVISDQVGSIVIDVLRAADPSIPTVSMVGGGNKPTLSTLQLAEAVPSGWTSIIFAADDWIGFSVVSATTVTRVTVCLSVLKL